MTGAAAKRVACRGPTANALVLTRPPGHHNGCGEWLEACVAKLQAEPKAGGEAGVEGLGEVEAAGEVEEARSAARPGEESAGYACHGGCIFNETVGRHRHHTFAFEASVVPTEFMRGTGHRCEACPAATPTSARGPQVGAR